MDFGALQACALDHWSPTIGDPTVMGWLTVVVYAAAAVASLWVWRRGAFPAHLARRERRFWLALAVLMALLAVNKQLDLQSFVTAIARCAAIEQGWYDTRRTVQVAFVMGILAVSVTVGLTAALLLMKSLARTWLALLGLILILGFVAVRALGFHHIDTLIGTTFLFLKVNWIVEIGGILLILAAGFLHPKAR